MSARGEVFSVSFPEAMSLFSTRKRFTASFSEAKRLSLVAGQKLARANNAGGSLQASVQKATLARDAFWARMRAEGEKYRAAYLLLAVDARKDAQDAVIAAAHVKHAAKNRILIERAFRFGEKAAVLEEASTAAANATRNVPEPDVVSYRRLQRLATWRGVNFADDAAANEVSTANFASMHVESKLVNPLVDWIYPADVKRAAGALNQPFGGVAEGGVGEEDAGWFAAVKSALGIGVAAAGGAALAAGTEAARGNAAAGAAVAGAGGILSAIAATLGIQMDRGTSQGKGMTSEGEVGFPWGVVLIVAAVSAGGYLLWKAAR